MIDEAAFDRLRRRARRKMAFSTALLVLAYAARVLVFLLSLVFYFVTAIILATMAPLLGRSRR